MLRAAAGGVTDVEPVQGGNALDKKKWEAEAMEWYRKAADANQADACYNLALLAFEVKLPRSSTFCRALADCKWFAALPWVVQASVGACDPVTAILLCAWRGEWT